MKKLFFALIALLATAPIALTSCNNDDEENGEKPSVTLTTPPHKADAAKFTLKTPLKIPGKDMKVERIELSESGHYFITYTKASSGAKTRGDGDSEYLKGLYKKIGGGFELIDFGTILLESDDVMVITPTGGSGLSVSYVKGSKTTTSEMTDYLCRTWTVTKTQLRFKVNGATVGREFQGACNMNEIIDYAKENGAKIKDDLKPNTIITSITFTDSGSFIIDYKNGKFDVGTWNWANISSGGINYKWDSADMGYSIEIGQAVAAFSGNTCLFGIKGKANNEDFEIVFTLQ